MMAGGRAVPTATGCSSRRRAAAAGAEQRTFWPLACLTLLVNNPFMGGNLPRVASGRTFSGLGRAGFEKFALMEMLAER